MGNLKVIDADLFTLSVVDLDAIHRAWASLEPDHRARPYLAALLVRTGVLEAREARETAITLRGVSMERVSFADEPVGPECFGGSDEESHYAAQTRAADLQAPEAPAIMPAIAPLPLGRLEGIGTDDDRELLRRIGRMTGWLPAVSIESVPDADPVYRIAYRFRPMRPEKDAPDWLDRTHVQSSGRKDERLTLALRVVYRDICQSHRSDL